MVCGVKAQLDTVAKLTLALDFKICHILTIKMQDHCTLMRNGLMKLFKLTAVCVALAATVTPAVSGKIERACNKSERNVSRSTCSCIQNVADAQLSRTDQTLAAKFFKDPQMAQDTRQSDRRSHEVFWKRYKAFGSVAARSCS